MLTLFTGAPGAGKTAQMVAELHELLKRETTRPIFVDGVNGLTIPHQAIDASKWHEELPDGALLLIDEVQRLWRPAGPGAKVPPEIQALETHRHRGIDIWMTTQAPGLVHGNVRRLVGRHIHLRDTGFLGRWWYEWPECSENVAWRTCTNKHKHKLPRHIFTLYKSASLHIKPERRIPTMAIVAIVAVVAFLVLLFMGYRMLNRKFNPAGPGQAVPGAAAPGSQAVVGSQTGFTSKAVTSSGRPAPIYVADPTAFAPRWAGRPESAPAYDDLVKVKDFPRVVAGFCQGEICRCFTQQGSDARLSVRECREWTEHRPFDPYRDPPTVAERGAPVASPSPAAAGGGA